MKFFALAENARKYGPAVTSNDVIKTIAVVIMIIDHVGYFFFPEELWWRAVGRIGFPVWFFMAGYAKPGKTGPEIKVFAVLMVLLDAVTGNTIFSLNALVSILLSRYVVDAIHKKELPSGHFPFVIAVMLVFYLPSILLFEYGTQAFMFAYAGYLCRQYPRTQNAYLTIGLAAVLFLLLQSLMFHFAPLQIIVMSIGTGVICWYLARFSAHRVTSVPERGVLNAVLRFIGRNTLAIYFLHYCAFEIAETLMDPPENFSIHFFVK